MNYPIKKKHIMIITGEPSGDMHGAHLIRHIKKLDSHIFFSGIGGPSLQKEGVELFYPIDRLAVMGFTEILMQLGHIKHAFQLFRKQIQQNKPDLLIFIDYPGFNLKAARYAKERCGIKILYYITPKVWAWKRSRLQQIRKYVDHCALILPFEEKLFKKSNISCTYVGNPLMDIYPGSLPEKDIRKPKHIRDKRKVTIGLLPGSRKTEVKNLGPILRKTAERLSQKLDHVQFIISKADSIDPDLLNRSFALENPSLSFTIHNGPVRTIFSKADLLIAASGTVTLEAALSGIPTIIIYKVSHLSYRIAKLVVKIKYAGLANLIVNHEIMPELLQYDAKPDQITKKALEMLNNLSFHQNRLTEVRQRLGKPGASLRTARIALSMMR